MNCQTELDFLCQHTKILHANIFKGKKNSSRKSHVISYELPTLGVSEILHSQRKWERENDFN